MKPLELTFRGLHSYCDEQCIDFQELGAHGLFGIFGPTGSGKSTILDAITLALYGTVDRAMSNTRGIINQNEDELHVSFSFELGDHRYVVERSFGRSSGDPEGTRSRYARLHRIGDDGSPAVLADGVTDTSRAVQELLGLTSDDFLRAVVLPQGKFDEFLKLTGASRGEMLERIFNLEQYGYALQARARDVRNAYERQRELTEVRREGLGDCSDEAVKAARTHLAECRKLFKEKDEHYETLRKQLEELEKLKELHSRFEQLQTRQKELSEKDEDIEKEAKRLAAANRAEPLREQLRRYGQLAESIEKLHEQVGKAQEEFTAAKVALDAAGQALETAEDRRDEQLPGLNDRRARLGTILDDYDQLETRSTELRAKTELRDGLATQVTELEEQVAEHERTRKKLRDQLKELRDQRSKQLVKPEERKKLEAALSALRELEDAEDELKRVAVEARDRRVALRAASHELRVRAEEVLPPDAVASVGVGPELEQLARAELREAEATTIKAREALDQARLHGQAGLLAANLEPGTPCPVCGSTEHPVLAQADAEELEAAQRKLNEVEARQKKLQAWVESVAQQAQLWAASQQEWQRALQAVKDHREPFRRAEERFARLWDIDRRDEVAGEQKELARRDEQAAELDAKAREAEEKLEACETSLEKKKSELAEQQKQHAEAVTQVSTLESLLKDTRDRVEKVTGGENPHELLDQTVKAIEALEQAVKTATEARDTAARKLEEAQKELTGSSAALKTLEEEFGTLEQRLDEQRMEAGFDDLPAVRTALMDGGERKALGESIEAHRQAKTEVARDLDKATTELDGRTYSAEEHEAASTNVAAAREERDEAFGAVAVAEERLAELLEKQKQWKELGDQLHHFEERRDLANELFRLLQGRKLVQFLASEHLRDIAGEASKRLGRLTGQRYALELDDDLEFTIRDDFNGGQRRSVRTLSGGETFLVSLALALALSSKIQLKGQFPLGFFFLDEGFGTLDEERLDEVVGTLEKLHDGERLVGVISHVRELRERLLRYLEVIPAGRAGEGSRVELRVQ